MALLWGPFRRLRLADVPGSPATAAVPLDETSRLETELRPLLALLADAQQRTRAIEEGFAQGVRQLHDQAEARAQQLVAEARAAAERERDAAIAERSASAGEERGNLLRLAEAEAERVRAKSARELPGLVERVVALVLAGGTAPPR